MGTVPPPRGHSRNWGGLLGSTVKGIYYGGVTDVRCPTMEKTKGISPNLT